jgi:ABC-2 type transport system ATP-binding protein
MIKISNLSRSIRKKKVLDGINIDFEDKIYSLIGRNGAGKTTLLNIIAGCLAPDSGTVEINGKKLDTAISDENIKYVCENVKIFNMPVKEIIKFAGLISDSFDAEFAKYAAKKLEIYDNTAKYKHLSKGVRSMAASVIGIADQKPVLLLDEPDSGLDSVSRFDLYSLISETYDANPRTIIISSHLLDELARTAENVIILDHGKILYNTDINAVDEMAYSVTGRTDLVDNCLAGHELIGKCVNENISSAYFFDDKIDEIPSELNISQLSLQEFFIRAIKGAERNE